MAAIGAEIPQLERFVLSSDRQSAVGECFPPGTKARAFFEVLHAVLRKDFKAATTLLTVHEQVLTGSERSQLEALLHLQMWDDSDTDPNRKTLQQYLIKQLNLNFQVYPNYVPNTPVDVDEWFDVGEPVYPSAVSEQEYSIQALLQKLQANELVHVQCPALSHLIFASAPFEVQVRILKERADVVPASLPGVEGVLIKWLATSLEEAGEWLHSRTAQLTAEHIQTLLASLPEAQQEPRLLRLCTSTLVKKLYPAGDWAQVSCDVEQVANLLSRIDQLSQQLGQTADWIRVQVLASQLELLYRQGLPLPVPLLLEFLQMARNIAWMSPPHIGIGPQGEAIHHGVSCDICHSTPLVGVRYKSQSRHDFDVCAGCISQAAAAGPFNAISGPVSNNIFLDFAHDLGPAVSMPDSAFALLETVSRWLKAVVFMEASDVFVQGQSPLAAAIAPEVYNKTVAEALLMSGRAVDQQHWFRIYESAKGVPKELVERQLLEFLPQNKAHYGVAEPVVIHLAVKNIPTVLIKVYDINGWNYYTNEKRELDPSLQLVGVSASIEKTFTCISPPLRREVLSWPLLEGRRGTFVVDIMGADMTRRAIIHKGQLRYLERLGSAGHELRVFYEDWSVVQSPRAWLEGRLYEADDRGEIVIPYAATENTVPLVLGDAGGASSLYNFSRKREVYHLSWGAYLDRECIHPHEEVPLIVNAHLTTHGAEPVPLELLEGVSLTIEMESADGNVTRKVMKDFELKPGPQAVSIRVQEHCCAVTATLGGRIRLVAPGANGEIQYQDIHAAERFNLADSVGSDVIWDVHLLGLPEGGWGLQVLGRAGEIPREPVRMQVSIEPVLGRDGHNSSYPFNFEVQTNATGLVKLGCLKHISSVRVSPPGGFHPGSGILPKDMKAHEANTQHIEVRRMWKLESCRKAADASSSPFQPLSFNVPVQYGAAATPITIARASDQSLIDEVFLWSCCSSGGLVCNLSGVHVEKQPSSITINGLTAGRYVLLDLATNEQSQLNVVETSVPPEHPAWQYNFIPARNLALQSRQPSQLCITGVEASASDGVSIQLQGAQGAQVVMVFRRFMPLDLERGKVHLGSEYSAWAGYEAEQQFLPPGSSYLQGTPLSPALQYVLQRRQNRSAPRPGNMLDRPSLLASPHYLHDTTTINNQLPTGISPTVYKAAALYGGSSRAISAQAQHEPGVRVALQLRKHAGPANFAPGFGGTPKGGGPGGAVSSSRFSSLDFCPSAVVMGPLPVDVEGQLSLSSAELKEMGVELSHSGHTVMLVGVVREGGGPGCSAFTTIKGAMTTIAAPVRDLVMSKPGDSGSQYIPVWDATSLQEGQQLQIEDISSSKMVVYDSISKAMELMIAALRSSHTQTSSIDMLRQDFAFLPDWCQLSMTQKLEHLKKTASCELSFFIYHHDPDFFKEVLLPTVEFKLKSERNFLDWWFLRDPDTVKYWSAPNHYSRLNAVEQILLAALSGPEELRVLARDWRQRMDPGKDAGKVARQLNKRARLMQLAIGAVGPSDTLELQADGMHEFGAGGGGTGTSASSLGEVYAFSLEEDMVGVAPQAFGSMARAAPVNMNRRELQMQQQQVLFKPQSVVQVWGETSYYKVKPLEESGNGTRVGTSEFWLDWAEWHAAGARGPFLSPHLPYAATSSTSALMALAVIGLPSGGYPKQAYTTAQHGAGITVSADSPCIVFHHQRQAAAAAKPTQSVLVSQTLIDPSDSQQEDPVTGDMTQKVVVPPLKTGHIYSYSVVVTNMSPSELVVDVVIQVPEGALQVGGVHGQATLTCHLDPFSGTQHSLNFYFPHPGTFTQYPCSVLRKGQLIWTPASPLPPLSVLTSLPPSHTTPSPEFNWFKFVSSAQNPEMLEYLATGDLTKAEIRDIAGRCHDRGFYLAATAALRARHIMDPAIWQFAVQHMDKLGLEEYLPNSSLPWLLTGICARTPLLCLEPRDANYRHLEYWRVLHRLAHPMPGQGAPAGKHLGSQLLEDNSEIRQQWQQFLHMNALKPALGPLDVLEMAQYFILQDRLDEAEQLLASFFTPEATEELGGACRMQVDYMRAWLDVSSVKADLAAAREVDAKYLGCKIPYWSERFQELHAMLEELSPQPAASGSSVLSPAATDKAAAGVQEAMMALKGPLSADGWLLVDVRNIREIQVNLYQIDIELLFTAHPFGQVTSASGGGRMAKAADSQGLGKVSYVRPVCSQTVSLAVPPPGEQVPLQVGAMLSAAGLGNSSVVVELCAGGLTRTTLRFASNLKVELQELQGLMQVRDMSNSQPLVATYVKVFARASPTSEPWLFKDGYTDRRGKFNYAAITAGVSDQTPTEFALLVVSTTHGAVILETSAPS